MLSTSVGSSLLFHTKVNQQTKQAAYAPTPQGDPKQANNKLMLSGDNLTFSSWDSGEWVFMWAYAGLAL